MNRRQMLMLTLPLMAAPGALMAAPAAKTPPKKGAGYDPSPTEVPIREGFEVGSIVVVSDDYYL